ADEPAAGDDEASAALFAEQQELLQAAQQMGYEAQPMQPEPEIGGAPRTQEAQPLEPEQPVSSHEAALPTAATAIAPEPEAAPSAASSMQSLLGKRNLLRSRLRGESGAGTVSAPPRATPSKPAAPLATAAVPPVAPAPSVPARQAAAAPAYAGPMTGYEDLPPLEAYDDSGSDYEEYLNQGFGDGPASAPAAQAAPGPSAAQKAHPASDDLPPWDLDGAPARAAAATVAAVPATPVATLLSVPENAQPTTAQVMETIDWDELESDAQPQEGEEVSRLIPSSLLVNCGDPWAELIARTGVGGRLRQLAINSVMTRQGELVSLVLKPEQRHLVSDRALADLAEIIGPEFGQAVRVEVTLGTDPARETPLEIEHRLYLGVREQVSRDLADDPNVQFLQQRFGAVLHPESIEPLSR
ncbi:DNA polymerase III subunit gamma/tau C-terminal domain-containing protein, partial [Aeromonas media]|uniref:DNA polymerase III subunit gamma/tau C-terminal domain-containing protein n=1 Tax=Aeromonas media TaxID=651 RepID=UPI002402CF65